MNQISTTLDVNPADLVLSSTHIWPSYLPLKIFLGAKDSEKVLITIIYYFKKYLIIFFTLFTCLSVYVLLL